MIEYLFGNYPDPVTGIFGYGFLATNVEDARVYGSEIEFRSQQDVRKIQHNTYQEDIPISILWSSTRQLRKILIYT